MKFGWLPLLVTLPVKGAIFVSLDRPEVTISSPLTLGQIASVRATKGEPVADLESLTLDLPLTGQISKEQVQQEVSDKAVVVGLGRVRVGRCQDRWQEQLASALKGQLQANMTTQQRLSEVKVYGERCPWLEEGKVVAIETLAKRLSRRIRISLELENQHRLPLIAELGLEQRLPVLVRDAAADELLNSLDLRWQWQSVSSFPLERFEPQGRQTKRPLRKGSVLTRENTEMVPDYHRGEQVLVRYQKGAIRIEAKGLLLNAGMQHEHARARLIESGAVVNVRLEEGGVVYALD